MRKKKKGPEGRNRSDPKRKDESKRLFNSKKKELETQEAKLFLKFAEIYPPADMKIDVALAIWDFLKFLKKEGYLIVHDNDLFVIPFSHLVKLKDLK